MQPGLDRVIRRIRHAIFPWAESASLRRHPEAHRPEGGILREVIFGANDGFVSNVALVAALAGGTTDPNFILLGGIAGLAAGAISMGLGAYVSTKSEREFRMAEEGRERWEIEHMREQELAETRQIFRLKGITGPLLDEVVDAVSRDRERWVQVMMTDELGFSEEPPHPYRSAAVMALSFAIAAFIPVAPYIFAEGMAAFVASLALTAGALVGVSAWRASLTSGRIAVKAFEMVVLAAIAVAVSNGIGRLVGVSLG